MFLAPKKKAAPPADHTWTWQAGLPTHGHPLKLSHHLSFSGFEMLILVNSGWYWFIVVNAGVNTFWNGWFRGFWRFWTGVWWIWNPIWMPRAKSLSKPCPSHLPPASRSPCPPSPPVPVWPRRRRGGGCGCAAARGPWGHGGMEGWWCFSGIWCDFKEVSWDV